MQPATPFAISTVYNTLRTLSAAVSDSTPPLSASFSVSIQPTMYADVLIVGSAVAGTTPSDSITWKIWRLVGSIVEQVDQFDMDAASITIPVTRTVPSGTDKLWITCTHNGGSSPTVSAVVSVRPILDGGMTQSKLSTDAQGYLYNRAISYDSPTNSDKVFPIYDISDKFANETPIDASGATNVATANFDIDMRGYRNVAIQILATSGVADSVKFALQSSKDPSGTNFATITAAGGNLVTNTNLSPDVNGDISVPIAATSYDIHYENISCLTLRIRVTVVSNANNILKIYTYKYY